MRGVVLLLLLLLLFSAACVPLALRAPAAPAPAGVPAGAGLQARLGEAPCLVVGLPAVPPLAAWDSWDCSTVRVLLSPTGLFGHYGSCEDDASMTAGVVSFTSPLCLGDALCHPQHVVRQGLSLAEAQALFEDPGSAGASHAYVRGSVAAPRRRALGAAAGLECRNVAPYLSSAGATTNLHWDGHPGILAQTAGHKRVALFAPGEMPAAHRKGSPCFRRSREAGRECPPGAREHHLLGPGQGLFIPAGWAHHITSLDAVTLGCVWRM